MEMTHDDFQRACQVTLRDIQEDPCWGDTRLFYLLCEAIRVSRECCELAERALTREQIKPLVEALKEAHPARVWDLARQHYTGTVVEPNCITEWHKGSCAKVDEALAHAKKLGMTYEAEATTP